MVAAWEIRQGDVLETLRAMPSESVHSCVTSPPYWSLRDYGVEGQLGLEKSPDEYIAGMVAVFSEVRRVLRKDGTLWLNIGDSYAGGGRGGNPEESAHRKQATNAGSLLAPTPVPAGLKPKDLVGIPWLLAFSLRAEGWYLRSEIIWSKPNPMPESVTDRPTKAHETIFLLSRSERYFYDAEAVREPSTFAGPMKTPDGWDTTKGNGDHGSFHREGREKGKTDKTDKQRGHGRRHAGFNERWDGMTHEEQGAGGRNKRSVWEIATHPFPEAHFATYPPALVRPCILAGTSERGCCPECHAPWKRIIEKGAPDLDHQRACGGDATGGYKGKAKKDYASALAEDPSDVKARILAGMMERCTVGWQPTCKCGIEQTVPCKVLDPFCGSGTTGLVAVELGRSFVGIELNPEYVEMSRQRITNADPLGITAQETALDMRLP